MIDRVSAWFQQFFRSAPQDWRAFVTLGGMRQVLALALVLLISPVVRTLVRRLTLHWKDRLAGGRWGERVFSVFDRALLPLSGWGLAHIAVGVYQRLNWERDLLVWVTPFFVLWLLYRVAAALLRFRFTDDQVRIWKHQVLLPVLGVVAVLHAVGLLDDLLHTRVVPREGLNVTVGSILAGLVVLTAFIVVSRAVRQFLGRVFLPQAGIEAGLAQILATVAAYTVLVIGILMTLGMMGLDLTTLTVVAGGLSVGLGFGLQEIVSNFMSGFILMLERSIGAGDVVQVGETRGIIETIGVRSTVVKTLDNVELVIPNSRFLTDTVTNFTRADVLVRVGISVGVSYDADPREVEQALLDAARHDEILPQPAPSVQFVDFGSSSLDFILFVWTRSANRIPVLTSTLRYRIWDSLAERNIEIPFPQQDVHIRSGVPWERLTPGTEGVAESFPRPETAEDPPD